MTYTPTCPPPGPSDQTRLCNLLTQFGVEFKTDTGDERIYVICAHGMDRVKGYPSFYTTFVFNEQGAFLDMGAYE